LTPASKSSLHETFPNVWRNDKSTVPLGLLIVAFAFPSHIKHRSNSAVGAVGVDGVGAVGITADGQPHAACILSLANTALQTAGGKIPFMPPS
jgi:hypothetical protein